MTETVSSTNNGVGMAAPQVDHKVRVFIGPEDMAFINPKIMQLKGAFRADNEGCLSLPGVFARVQRYQKVMVVYYDENWDTIAKTFKGFDARIIQHEMDHLDGINFPDHVKDKSPSFKRELRDMRDGSHSNLKDAPYKIKKAE